MEDIQRLARRLKPTRRTIPSLPVKKRTLNKCESDKITNVLRGLREGISDLMVVFAKIPNTTGDSIAKEEPITQGKDEANSSQTKAKENSATKQTRNPPEYKQNDETQEEEMEEGPPNQEQPMANQLGKISVYQEDFNGVQKQEDRKNLKITDEIGTVPGIKNQTTPPIVNITAVNTPPEEGKTQVLPHTRQNKKADLEEEKISSQPEITVREKTYATHKNEKKKDHSSSNDWQFQNINSTMETNKLRNKSLNRKTPLSKIEEQTYLIDAIRVQVEGLPLTATIEEIKDIRRQHGGTCQVMLTDRGMDNPIMYGTVFYYKTEKQANHVSRCLNGQKLGGSKGLLLMIKGLQRIMIVQKHLRNGNLESSTRNRDHHRQSANSPRLSTSKTTHKLTGGMPKIVPQTRLVNHSVGPEDNTEGDHLQINLDVTFEEAEAKNVFKRSETLKYPTAIQVLGNQPRD